jgi:outer membrane protein assembly factor BamB
MLMAPAFEGARICSAEPRPSEKFQTLRKKLYDADRQVRLAAVLALRGSAEEAGIIEDLSGRLKDADVGVRQAAASILGAYGPRAKTAIPALIDAMRDEQLPVARVAILASAQVGAESDEVLRALTAASQFGDRDRRATALAALGRIGPAAKAGLASVQAALAERDAGVRAIARQALRQIDPQLANAQLGPPFDAISAGKLDQESLEIGPGDWPQWGGSRLRNNVTTGRNIPTAWDVTTRRNIKWTAKLGSQTYGNPAVANGKVLIGTNNGAGYLKRYPATVDLGVMLCFDEEMGEFLWQYSSEKLPIGRVHDWPLQGMPSTPVVNGDRLWAVTNRCEVVCLDTEGFRDGENDGPYRSEANENLDEADVVWKLDMIKELGVSPHNMSNCSPLLVDGRLIVCTSNGVDEGHVKLPSPEAPSFLALDCATGTVLWSDNSPGANILHAQWASPSYAVLGESPQVIFGGGDGWLYSFDPAGDGKGKAKLLWKFDCNRKDVTYSINGRNTRIHQIGFVCIYDGLLYFAPGEDPEHGEGPGRVWCIDPTKRLDGGDVSAELVIDREGKIVPHRRICAVDPSQGERVIANPDSAVVWQYTQSDHNFDGKLDFEEGFHRSLSTPVIQDDILYIADFSGLFHCLDAKTGEEYWNCDLFAACWGSPLLVHGKVYIGDEEGKVTIFRHSADPAIALPAGKPFAQIEMPNSVYPTPVVANDVLYIATKDLLYAIEGQPEVPDGAPH